MSTDPGNIDIPFTSPRLPVHQAEGTTLDPVRLLLRGGQRIDAIKAYYGEQSQEVVDALDRWSRIIRAAIATEVS